MKRTLLVALLFAGPLWAAGPSLNIPPEVIPVGEYATIIPQTDAKSITYVGKSGIEPFPSAFLKDPRAFILPTRGLPAGRYWFSAVGTLNDEQSRQDFQVVVGESPAPPPAPGPSPGPTPTPPGPTPAPSPAPIPAEGLHVLIVYESADLSKYPSSQLSVLNGAEVRAYLNAKCANGPDGKTRQWRMWDQNVQTTGESQLWKDAMNRPRKSVPWILISTGKAGFEGPLPTTVDETLKLLKTYGG